jgi:hypothetical protein
VIDASKNTIIQKNYKAKDIALLITTLYASPGDASYEYPLNGAFTIKIGGGQVSVADEKGEYAYWYSRPENVKDIVVTDENGNIITDESSNIVTKPDEKGDIITEIKPPLDGWKISFTKSRKPEAKRALTARLVRI